MHLSPVTTIVPRVVDHGDGQWRGKRLPAQVPAAGAATEDTCGDRVSADGQWSYQLSFLVPAAGHMRTKL